MYLRVVENFAVKLHDLNPYGETSKQKPRWSNNSFIITTSFNANSKSSRIFFFLSVCKILKVSFGWYLWKYIWKIPARFRTMRTWTPCAGLYFITFIIELCTWTFFLTRYSVWLIANSDAKMTKSYFRSRVIILLNIFLKEPVSLTITVVTKVMVSTNMVISIFFRGSVR